MTKSPSPTPMLLSLPQEVKDRLRILYLAKWAHGDGTPQGSDGTHATYHAEIRELLRGRGYQVDVGHSYERLFEQPDYDYLFTLFNRGGFLNSEMLAPLLATYRGTPHLGATPILRGLGDDKHLTKLAARARGLDTPDWEIYRRGSGVLHPPRYKWQKLIVKPNASSASWGIGLFDSWEDALQHVHFIHREGHDAIVENFINGYELAVPVVGTDGALSLPIIRFTVPDENAVRSYEQKRHLTGGKDEIKLSFSDNTELNARLRAETEKLLPEFWPNDYCRLEFKYDEAEDRLYFIEINLSCNLWSKKATGISFASLNAGGHEVLLESILVHSLRRQGLVDDSDVIRTPIKDPSNISVLEGFAT